MNIVERFINYTRINTTISRENGANGIMPSSSGQMTLAKMLGEELQAMGLKDVKVRDTAIVTAILPGNTDVRVSIVIKSYLCRGDKRRATAVIWRTRDVHT